MEKPGSRHHIGCLRKGQSASKSQPLVWLAPAQANRKINPACQDSNCWDKVPRWKQAEDRGKNPKTQRKTEQKATAAGQRAQEWTSGPGFKRKREKEAHWLSKTRANETSSQQNQWISKLNLANYRDADHHTKMAPKLLCRDGGHSKLPGQNQNEGRRNLATRQEGGGGGVSAVSSSRM